MIRVVIAAGWALQTAQWLVALRRARRDAAAREEWPREAAIRAGMLGLVVAAIAVPSGGWVALGPGSAGALVALFLAGQALAMVGRAALGDAWSIGTRPRPGARPRRRGVYGAVRHPIYAGNTTAVVAQALLLQNAPALLLLVGSIVVVVVKIRAEERSLRDGSGG